MSQIRIPASNVERMTLARKCYQMRIEGKTAADIAEELQITTSMADSYANMHEQTQPIYDVPETRKIQAARIEKWLDELNCAYRAGKVDVAKAIDSFIKLAAREAKLLGLDAPVRHEFTEIKDEAALALELIDQVQAAKAKKALEQQELAAERDAILGGE